MTSSQYAIVETRSATLAAALLILGALLACKSAEEKARDEQHQKQRDQKGQAKQSVVQTLQTLEPKKSEWASLRPPDALESPYLKGKLVVLYRRAQGVAELLENDAVGLQEIYARTPAEVGTVAQVDCFEVRSGSYVTEDAEKKEIPAFKSECEVALIDLSVPAVIDRKKFENAKFTEKIGQLNFDWAEIKRSNKFVAPEPQVEIRTYLRNLPRK